MTPDTLAALPALAWTPRHDQIVVRPFEASSRTRGGLITPEAHAEAPQQGLIVAVGPDVPAGLRANHVVAYGKFAGIPFEDPRTGFKLLVMRETECLLVRGDEVVVTEHVTAGGKRVIHEATESCEHCPTPELDAMREQFRQRNLAEMER
ncbi:MAG: co-chaperone GroES [Acidobacteria bacterium]|nr:co-chaperone GroES [Acidobacteriota bacterium]